jgi:oligoendopeptidase F
MTTTARLPERAEVPQRETWDLTSLFADDGAFEQASEATERAVAAFAARRGHVATSAEALLESLSELSDLMVAIGRLRSYAQLPVTTDQTDDAARRRAGRFSARLSRWLAALSFVRPELLTLEPETRAAFERERPSLRRFAPYLDRLEVERPHTRSAEVEDVLATASAPLRQFERAHAALTAADLRFAPVSTDEGEVEVAPSTIRGLESSSRRPVRQQAWRSFADGFLGMRDTLAELYLGVVHAQALEARVRGYASGEAAALAQMHVPSEVLDATLAAFTRRLPVWHRYWEVRRALVGVDALAPWDVFAPLARVRPEVPYRRAAEWIIDSSAPLGETYQARLRQGLLEERWVDRPANRGKREGAFCASSPGTAHPFVFVTYTGDLPAASTLAHEFGHAMHADLSHAEGEPLDDEALSMTVAETASNAQQALLRSHLLTGEAAADTELEIAVLDEALLNYHRYFFVMPTLVRFERAVHARVWSDDVPTGSELVTLLRDLFQEGYGPALALADGPDGDRVGVAWAQFGHLYVPFYTFQYAVGIAAASALTARIAAGEPDAAPALLSFLRAGASIPPVELFRSVGLDVTTPEPVEQAFDVVEGYVSRLEGIASQRAHRGPAS